MRKNPKTGDRGFMWSYAFSAGGGFNFILALITSYLSGYLTDNLLIPAAAVSVLMTVATIWDAVNDPMMGAIADRTKSRWGRYRGYFLFAPFSVAILAIALFCADPGWSSGAKLTYVSVVYILYGMAATVLTMPTYAILPAHTLDPKLRNRTVVLMMIITAVGFNIVMAVGPMMMDHLAIPVAVFAVMGIVAYLGLFKKAKENYLMPVGERSAMQDLKAVLRHKELWSVFISWFLANLGYGMMFSASYYYITYYIGQPAMLTIYMVILGLGSLISMVLMPLMLKLCKTPRRTLVVTQMVTAVLYAVLFVVGGSSFGLLTGLSFVAALFSCMQNGIVNILLNDTIDYVMLMDGLSLNGIISAVRGFASKCGAGLAMAVITAIISIAGWAPNASAQSASAMIGLNMARFGAPAIISVLLIICLCFYPIEKHYGEIEAMKATMHKEETAK